MPRIFTFIFLTMTISVSLIAQARTTPQQFCEATKLLAQGAFTRCRLAADAANAKKPALSKRDAAYLKCAQNLAAAYARAETKAANGGGSCPTTGDTVAINDLLGQCTVESRQATAGQSCSGIGCAQPQCEAGQTTTVRGTVYAPNGTLPIPNAVVFVPDGPVGSLPEGIACDRCSTLLGAKSLVRTSTNAAGEFVLQGVPATSNVPLVMQIGKWRRQVVIPSVAACTETQLAAELTRLPRSRDEGDIPRIAVSTGGADALECLIRKLGIEDSEFTTPPGLGHIHLFAGSGGTNQFDAAVNGGSAFAKATALWGSTNSLDPYDVVLLSCEGSQNPSTKPNAALQAMKDYADHGGRVFFEHWHNYWLQQGPAPWPSMVTFNALPNLGNLTADIDTSHAHGAVLADWLENIAASATRGKIDILNANHTATAVDTAFADRLIYADTTINGQPSIQFTSFTTPVEQPAAARCGRVAFSDMHMSSGETSSGAVTFPSGGCKSPTASLSPQEKALAFMIFDIQSCVGTAAP